jgi:very-short-patch-repair endonuclease
MFATLLKQMFGECEREYRFHPTRKFRFDYAIPSKKIAIEQEGGAWTNGRHTRGKGYISDMEKYNLATSMGWRVLRFTPEQMMKTETINLIKKVYDN